MTLFRIRSLPLLVVCLAFTAAAVPADEGRRPTFSVDVMSVLSKAGCNSGGCHGNQNGKGGFRLSLRGQDPDDDYRQITRQYALRRIDPFRPDHSLLLLKPLGAVAHGGGTRFRSGSAEHEILRDWVADGMRAPGDDSPQLAQIEVTPAEAIVTAPQVQIQLQVVASFDDGSRRDVTSMAVYETSNLGASVDSNGLVTSEKPGETAVLVRYLQQHFPVRLIFIAPGDDFQWIDPPQNNYVDRFVFEKLRSMSINPSPLCDDRVFVRRAYLDAIGRLPSADEARMFVADDAPDKRARLIDELLQRDAFADFWALKWSDVLRNEEKVLDPQGVQVFHAWIRQAIATGKPIDQFVRELVTGSGSTYKNPAANFYRANRDPLTRAETTARLFLGTRLQCARCHNHPFDRWTQDDYYRWAAVFARIDYEIIENKRRDKLDKNEFQGEQIVRFVEKGEVQDPNTGADARPKLLGAAELEPAGPANRLTPMADWLTSADNDAFAASQVNWIWFHVMGRGLVEPVDDFRITNPPINPPLLEALADDFVRHRFDLRHLVRTIMTSRTYQLSSVPNDSNVTDELNYSRAIIRRLTAEQLLDAQCQVLDAFAAFNGYPTGTRAVQVVGVERVRRRDKTPGGGDRFLMTFGKPQRLLACECERSNETALAHAFNLVSGSDLHARISRPGNRIDRLAGSSLSDREVVEALFWTALSRPPANDEIQVMLDSMADGDRFTALQDIAWALLNSKEFVFRR